MALDLYINESASDPAQALVSGILTTQPAPHIVLAQGDMAKSVNLHWLNANPDTTDPSRPFIYNTPPATVSLAIGTIDAAVTGGTFTITETAASQTTAAIAYNASAATVQAAIRAACTTNLPACTVTGSDGGPWTVDRVTTGTLAAPTGTGSGLTPDGSGVEVIAYDGTASLSKKFTITLNRAPAVLTTSWSTNTPTSAAISTPTAGTTGTNEVQRLTMPTDIYGGTITIGVTLPHGPVVVTAVAVSTDATNAVCTSTGHGLATGDSIVLVATGTASTPTVVGTRTVTVIDNDSFSVAVNTTVAGTGHTFTAAALLRSIGPLAYNVGEADFESALEAHSSTKAVSGSFSVSRSVGASVFYDITFKGALAATNIATTTVVTDALLYPSYLTGTLNCRTAGAANLLAGSLVPVTTNLEIQKTVSSNVTMSAFRDDVQIKPKLISQ